MPGNKSVGTMINDQGERYFYGKAGRRNARFSAIGSTATPIPETWMPPLNHQAS